MAPDSQTPAGASAAAPVDWGDWHASYERPDSPMAQRLALVQAHVSRALAERPQGPISVISVCAGQGHDLIGALRGHPRRNDVRARLVELDVGNVQAARETLRNESLGGIEVSQDDASSVDAYAGATPADVVLLCGVLGNISTADVERTVSLLPALCAPGAHVVWTRNRNPPDLVPRVLEMLGVAGFQKLRLDDGPNLAIGTSRLVRAPDPALPAGTRLFAFIGHGALWPHLPEGTRAAMMGIFDTAGTLTALVEAVRAIPLGGPALQSVEAMLREGRGTSVAKHLFLADMLARRFPATDPVPMLRLYELDGGLASSIYGDEAAASLGGGSIDDVHGYVTVNLDGERVELDVSVPGPPWDGRNPLAIACGAGDDRAVGEDASAQLQEIVRGLRSDPRRVAFEAALAGTSLIQPHRDPVPEA